MPHPATILYCATDDIDSCFLRPHEWIRFTNRFKTKYVFNVSDSVRPVSIAVSKVRILRWVASATSLIASWRPTSQKIIDRSSMTGVWRGLSASAALQRFFQECSYLWQPCSRQGRPLYGRRYRLHESGAIFEDIVADRPCDMP